MVGLLDGLNLEVQGVVEDDLPCTRPLWIGHVAMVEVVAIRGEGTEAFLIRFSVHYHEAFQRRKIVDMESILEHHHEALHVHPQCQHRCVETDLLELLVIFGIPNLHFSDRICGPIAHPCRSSKW